MRFLFLGFLVSPLLISARAVDVSSDLRPRADATLPFNVANPGPTPAFVRPVVAALIPVKQVATLISATTASADSLLAQAAVGLSQTTNGLVSTVNGLLCGLLGCVAVPPTPTVPIDPVSGPACLDSSYNDTVITSLLYYGGPNTIVYLCAGAVIPISNAISFFAQNQTITTGSGVIGTILAGGNRATLKVMGPNQSVAIFGANNGLSGCKVSRIIIDGGRQRLGRLSTGQALIEMGGTQNLGQVVTGCKLFEPRGWTALHMIEGYQLTCSGSIVTDNTIGPCGHAPTGSQFRKRDTGTYSPGEWADGISMACRNSVVTGNTITDTTDGGIVIFQAPGSKISGNTIVADQRQALGGINMVDLAPFNSPYTDVVVSGNTLNSKNSMMKIGIAMGTLSWGSLNSTTFRTSGGTVKDNIFTSGSTGYFGFGITVSGHESAVVEGNRFLNANFGGVKTQFCFDPMPSFGPLYQNPYTSPGNTLQSQFRDGDSFMFMICSGPGSVTLPGVTQ